METDGCLHCGYWIYCRLLYLAKFCKEEVCVCLQSFTYSQNLLGIKQQLTHPISDKLCTDFGNVYTFLLKSQLLRLSDLFDQPVYIHVCSSVHATSCVVISMDKYNTYMIMNRVVSLFVKQLCGLFSKDLGMTLKFFFC